MIYFNLNLRNPWCGDRFKNIKCWSGSTFIKNKYWEVQVMKDCELFRIEFSWTTKEDHAGLRIEFGLIGYKATFTVYDNRHWDYEKQTWHVYNKEL